MLNCTEKIIESPLKNHLIYDVDLANLFKGTPARRYGLVNKAMKQHELLSLRRGLYMLAPKYQSNYLSAYYVANHIVSYSFVTAESALQFHQWIPERIAQTISVAAFGRKRRFDTPIGQFIYNIAPVVPADFFVGVSRIESPHDHSIFMATPLRALADYIHWHKIENANQQFLHIGLRIEHEQLQKITASEINALMVAYHSRRVNTFLNNLLRELRPT